MRNLLRTLVVATCIVIASQACVVGQETASPTADQSGKSAAPARRTLLGLIHAGGLIGYITIGLSIIGGALVVDGFLRLKEEKLVPAPLVEQCVQMTQQGRFSELLALCKTHQSLFAHVIAGALSQGNWGVEAVREAMRQHGEEQFTRLRQRLGYIGFIATVAPMLGLLGTVQGLIQAFQLLGESKGAATPDQLAVGIALALVTTFIGLVVALPLMFFHAHLRDRLTRISQKAAGECEKLLRIMTIVVENRTKARPVQPAASPPAPAYATIQPTAAVPMPRPEGVAL